MDTDTTSIKAYSNDRVASFLLERILKGEWGVGEKIPSVDQLEAALPASRMTISKGIGKLCDQGYLRTAWRSGTYVRSNILVRRILLHVGGDQGALPMHPFSLVVTRKLEKLLARRNMQVEIQWEARRAMLGERLASDLTDDRFHGAISVQSNLPAILQRELPSLLGTLPMVHVGIHHQVPWVFVDMSTFNRLAADYCRQVGSRCVLYASPPDSPEFQEFSAISGVETLSLTPDTDDLDVSSHEEQGYRLFLDAWHRFKGRIDAVIAADDMWAKGIVQALLAVGLEKTQHLKVVALTNKDSGIFYPFPVQSIETDTDEIAERTIKILIDQLTHGVPGTPSGVSVRPAMGKNVITTPINEVTV
ncbi:MAG: GntR family transcriptional regulator [Kiritimatiellia bacterium]